MCARSPSLPWFGWALYLSSGALSCSAPDAPHGRAQPGEPEQAPEIVHGDSPPASAGAEVLPSEAVPPETAQPAGTPLDAGLLRPVRVRFRALVGSEPFACDAAYSSRDGVSFTPADLRLFVQDLTLLAADGAELPVLLDVRAPWQIESVALLDFEDASGACLAGTAAMNLEVTGRVPAGDYRGLAFSNGVPEALNHADPARLPPPLQAGSMSWGWLLGYRFVMAELAVSAPVIDAGPAGSALLHVGSTGCNGTPGTGIRCSKPNRNRVRLPDFDPDADTVVIDVAELFADTDLTRVTTCHSSGAECQPWFERMGIDLADGAARDAQAVYRAERSTTVER